MNKFGDFLNVAPGILWVSFRKIVAACVVMARTPSSHGSKTWGWGIMGGGGRRKNRFTTYSMSVFTLLVAVSVRPLVFSLVLEETRNHVVVILVRSKIIINSSKNIIYKQK